MSDGERCVIIVLVVSLVLRGEAVAQVRIQHVVVYMYVVDTTTHTNLRSSSIISYRLWTCRSSSVVIVHL